GDVLARPHEAIGISPGVAFEMRVGDDDPLVAVGQDDAVVEPVRHAVAEKHLDPRTGVLAIVRMHLFEKRIELRHSLAAIEVENAIELVGPPGAIGADAPLPAADPGDPL